MAEQLTKKRKIRAGHRGYATKTLKDIEELVGSYNIEWKAKAEALKATLEEQLDTLKKLDDEILEIITDKSGEEELGTEIEGAGKIKEEVRTAIARVRDLLEPTPVPQTPMSQPSTPSSQSTTGISHEVRVRLPKLQLSKFGGRIEEWQEFWDSFQSNVHGNTNIPLVDKFSYLKMALFGAAKATIAGLSLTSANYEAAVEILQKRYGKPENLKKAHINEMLKIQAVQNDRDVTGLRRLIDVLEAKHRSLQALGVAAGAYEGIVVPSILEKIPESVRLIMTRGKQSQQWTIEELLAEMREEIELREQCTLVKQGERPRRQDQQQPSSASALLTGTSKRLFCAFCTGQHAHKDCNVVKTNKERKELFRKYGRCYICAKKGHISSDCFSSSGCSICSGKHHISICDKRGERDSGGGNHSNGSSADNTFREGNQESHAMHVGGAIGRVALQTAQAVLKGEKTARIRVLFDAGSHRSFVTSKTVKSVGLKGKRKEWLEINAFGQKEKDSGLREVFDLEVLPINGGKGQKIEAFEVPRITQIRNEHVELRKVDYPHLHTLWFSDVNKSEEVLEVDLLIGADYLWCFQGGRTIRGEKDEPVAVETSLGWVLSGPLKPKEGMSSVNSVVSCVNLIGCEKASEVRVDAELESNVQKLWDYETLGIREENVVHEALKDGIEFTGERYCVKLPWKEGHGCLASNYHNGVTRLKGLLTRLKKEPEVRAEYNAIIKQQEEAGVIERVFELESANKVHYLAHFPVIRIHAKTTKCRVVYQANAKDKKGGVSLNDCLHTGPALTPLLYDILVRFRHKKVALVGDIEKAFLNIEVDEPDRDSLRFLWVEDVEKDELVPVVYRFCRVVFGVNCSPFLLNATLRYHLDTFAEEDPEFVRVMKESFYVDDLVSGAESTGEALELQEKAKKRLATGGFKLRKWLSNDSAVMQKIGENEKLAGNAECGDDATYAKSVLGVASETVDKVLGHEWDCQKDEFCFDLEGLALKAADLKATKRNLLKVMAGMYDPLRIASPILVGMKVLFQDLCREKVGWDEELNEERKKRFVAWLEDLKRVTVGVVNEVVPQGVASVIDIERFSNVTKLLRVTAWVKRFVFNLRARKKGVENKTGLLKASDLLEAEVEWVKSVQAELKTARYYKELAKDLGLREENEVLKCFGRLGNSELDTETRSPVILAREHRFTRLVIESCHVRVSHTGVRATLAELRSRYWVPKGRQTVKKFLSECVACKRVQGRAYDAPGVAALPNFRASQAASFGKTGLDFGGPIYVKGKDGMEKTYIALFTCCVTRAVHLELVEDLTTPTFLRCMRRFCARRGTPSLIVSDNAKTFKAAAKFLKELYDQADVRAYFEENRIQWRFNLEKAPWWGGFFERMIGTVKRCLKKTLGNARLSYDELQTTLIELEGTLNSRPLTYEYDELGAEMLTPSHLIFGRRLLSLPDELRDDEDEEENGFLRRFRYLAKKRGHFWNRWHKEYLVDLREHHKCKGGGGRKCKVGEVVLVHEDVSKRSKWKMAVVEELIIGSDGEVRGAKLRVLSRGKPIKMNRPVQRLYPLEVRCHEDVRVANRAEVARGRQVPRRAAALDARWRTRLMIDS